MKTALAIRHVHFEHLGALAPLLEAAGYGVRYEEAPTAELDGLLPDLLVVLGGPISVNDAAVYPFLEREQSLVKRQLERNKPLLGICLGAQMMARALGARVFSMGRKEIGWSPLQATAAGRRSPLHHLLAPDLEVLHLHGETFDLPPGATCLASTAICQAQAFSVGDHALGLQFHPEVTAEQLESWYVAHTCELSAANVDVIELRRQSQRKAGLLAEPLKRFFSDWIQKAAAPADGASVLQPAP
jgi:GMP synthase (glutamine-hydrolysing)